MSAPAYNSGSRSYGNGIQDLDGQVLAAHEGLELRPERTVTCDVELHVALWMRIRPATKYREEGHESFAFDEHPRKEQADRAPPVTSLDATSEMPRHRSCTGPA